MTADDYAAARLPHSVCVAMRAPSASDFSFAHMMVGMDAARERALRKAAVGAAHDVLAADDLGEPHDPLGDQFGMLDDIGGVTDHARDQDFSGRKLHALPHSPLMGVARIGGLEGIMADAHLKHEIDDVLERHVEGMRAVPAAPADVIARALFRDAAQRVVERIDAQLRPAPILGVGHRRHHALVHIGQEGVVDLDVKPGVDDRFVFLMQRVGERGQKIFFILVMLVLGAGQRAGRRDDRQECLQRRMLCLCLGDAGLEVGISRKTCCVGIFDRAVDDDAVAQAFRQSRGRVVFGVEFGKCLVVAPAAHRCHRVLGFLGRGRSDA